MVKSQFAIRNSQFGFTLVELLVSISILAAVVSVSLVNLRAGGRERVVESEARQFASVIRSIEQRAVNGIDGASGQALLAPERYAVVLKGGIYLVMIDSGIAGTLGVFDGNEKIISTHTLPADITVSVQPTSNPTVIGFATGTNGFLVNTQACTYGGPRQPSPLLTVTFSDNASATTIELQCLTGTVTIQ